MPKTLAFSCLSFSHRLFSCPLSWQIKAYSSRIPLGSTQNHLDLQFSCYSQSLLELLGVCSFHQHLD
jgi:hypothetical protein